MLARDLLAQALVELVRRNRLSRLTTIESASTCRPKQDSSSRVALAHAITRSRATHSPVRDLSWSKQEPISASGVVVTARAPGQEGHSRGAAASLQSSITAHVPFGVRIVGVAEALDPAVSGFGRLSDGEAPPPRGRP